MVTGGWWLVVGGWWLVVGGWWLVAGGWWFEKIKLGLKINLVLNWGFGG